MSAVASMIALLNENIFSPIEEELDLIWSGSFWIKGSMPTLRNFCFFHCA
jgi:hypothetical protein